MTNNEFLQRVYEANPDGWVIQVLCGVRGWIAALNQEYDQILEHTRVRLKPILPEGTPEPPEEAYLYGPEKGGLPLGFGPFSLPGGGGMFLGWGYSRIFGTWPRSRYSGFDDSFYILDLSDENSRAILEANGLWPGHDNGEQWCPNAKPGTDEYARKCYVREGLIEFVERCWPDLKVVPKDAPDAERDEWACLDELDWQVMDMGEQQWVDMPRPQAIGFGLVHGPGAVRVRKEAKQ